MRSLFLAILLVALAFALPASSQQKWEKVYGGTGFENAWHVGPTSDGGYIFTGGTDSSGTNMQVYLVSTNASGDTLWTRNYGGMGDDGGCYVQQTSDGGYIIAGHTNSFGNDMQFYLVKTNASGDTLWTRNYGGVDFEYARSAQQTSDGGYIVAGYTLSFGNGYQVYLVKTNATGDTLWTRNYGGTDTDRGNSVQQTRDGGYIVAGYTWSFGNYSQVYLVKTNASGDTLWTRNYGGISGNDYGTSVQQTSDGGYIVAGVTTSYGNDNQVYLVKTNASGDALWSRIYGGMDYDFGNSVQQTSDGGYIVAGWTSSFGNPFQVYLVKTNPFGDTLWTRTYGGALDEYGNTVRQTTDGGYIIAGEASSFGNSRQAYLIKTDAYGSSGVETAEGRGQRVEVRLTATPNPFSSFATVPGHSSERFDLYDISGRLVGTYRGDRIGEGLRAGVYFVRAEKGKGRPVRIVKVR
jgi:hypothetical protein